MAKVLLGFSFDDRPGSLGPLGQNRDAVNKNILDDFEFHRITGMNRSRRNGLDGFQTDGRFVRQHKLGRTYTRGNRWLVVVNAFSRGRRGRWRGAAAAG